MKILLSIEDSTNPFETTETLVSEICSCCFTDTRFVFVVEKNNFPKEVSEAIKPYEKERKEGGNLVGIRLKSEVSKRFSITIDKQSETICYSFHI